MPCETCKHYAWHPGQTPVAFRDKTHHPGCAWMRGFGTDISPTYSLRGSNFGAELGERPMDLAFASLLSIGTGAVVATTAKIYGWKILTTALVGPAAGVAVFLLLSKRLRAERSESP